MEEGLRVRDRGRSPPAGTHLHEVVDGLQIRQVVVVDVHTDAEVEAGVASVNDLEVPELRAERRSGPGCPRAQRAGQRGAGTSPPFSHAPRGPALCLALCGDTVMTDMSLALPSWAYSAVLRGSSSDIPREGFPEEGAPDLRSGG